VGLAWILGTLVVLFGLLTVALRGDGDEGWLQVGLDLAGLAVVSLVGSLIAARLPANPYGWLWLGVGLIFGAQGLSEAVRSTTGTQSWALQWAQGVSFLAVLVLLLLAFLLFPTGRLPSRAWRWLPRVAVVVAAGSSIAGAFAPLDGAVTAPWTADGAAGAALGAAVEWGIRVLFLLFPVAAGSVVFRFQRAGELERQQLKWLVLAAGLSAVLILVDLVGPDFAGPVWSALNSLTLIAIPAAVGVAVLRYRLYEIDRIVSRTVTYGVLTAAIFAVYVVVVGGLTALGVPEGRSDVAVALVTLAVAALVGRVRRRLQTAVDRQFDRTRYDAARALDAFAARLRHQVDLDQITAGLCDTVSATVAPGRVAVWLAPADRGRPL